MKVDESVAGRISEALAEGKAVVIIRGPRGSVKASSDVEVIEA